MSYPESAAPEVLHEYEIKYYAA